MKPSKTTNTLPASLVGLLVLGFFVGIFGATRLFAQESPPATEGVHTDDLFELGDGLDPVEPGIGDIVGSTQPGPDWDDLFDADANPKDAYDELGNPGSNGVPDFLDTWGIARGRRDIAYIADDLGDAVDAADDLGNAYAYTAFNSSLELIIYAGVERLSTAPSQIVFEFNRELFSMDEAGGLVGQKSAGDLRIHADFNAGVLDSLSLERWGVEDPQSGAFGWLPLESLPLGSEESAQQCNDSGSVCAMCNGGAIDAGSWPSFDASGTEIPNLPKDTFLEIGINLGRLLAVDTYSSYYRTRFTSFQVSTPEDQGLAAFLRAEKVAASQPLTFLPEPTSEALLLAGCIFLALAARRRVSANRGLQPPNGTLQRIQR